MINTLLEFGSKHFPLSPEEEAAVTELTVFRNVNRGTVLLTAGQMCSEFYIVIKGCIRCYYVIDGVERTTEFYTEGQSFSPPVNGTQVSDFYLVCLEDSTIAVAQTAMLEQTIGRFPRLETLCRLITEDRLAESRISFANFKNSSPEGRYLSLCETRPDLLHRVPLNLLAGYLGMTPESLSRIRRRISQRERSVRKNIIPTHIPGYRLQ